MQIRWVNVQVLTLTPLLCLCACSRCRSPPLRISSRRSWQNTSGPAPRSAWCVCVCVCVCVRPATLRMHGVRPCGLLKLPLDAKRSPLRARRTAAPPQSPTPTPPHPYPQHEAACAGPGGGRGACGHLHHRPDARGAGGRAMPQGQSVLRLPPCLCVCVCVCVCVCACTYSDSHMCTICLWVVGWRLP
jgi:hypothetical protein